MTPEDKTENKMSLEKCEILTSKSKKSSKCSICTSTSKHTRTPENQYSKELLKMWQSARKENDLFIKDFNSMKI
jgi:hypothetical protein